MSYISGQRFHNNSGASTSKTVTVNVPASCETVLVLAVRGYPGDGAPWPAVTGATLGGASMALQGAAAGAFGNLGASVLSFANPTSGSQSLVITWDAAFGRYDIVVAYLTDTGALSGFSGNVAALGAASATVASRAGDTVYAITVCRDSSGAPSITAGTGETILEGFANETAWGGNATAAVLSEAGATSVVVAPSVSSADSASVLCAISESGTGAPPPPSANAGTYRARLFNFTHP